MTAGNRSRDPFEALGDDPLDLGQEGGRLVDDVQGAVAEPLDNPLGVGGADALDEPGPEVPGDPGGRVRGGGLEFVGLELGAVGLVVDPLAAGLDVLAGDDAGASGLTIDPALFAKAEAIVASATPAR